MSDFAEKFPEHLKLEKISAESQSIGAFLDHMSSEKGFQLLKWVEETYEEPCPGYGIFYSCAGGKRVLVSGDDDDEDQITELTCKKCDGTGVVEEHFKGYRPISSIQDTLAEYFGIDQKKIEQEKRAMIDAIREGLL